VPPRRTMVQRLNSPSEYTTGSSSRYEFAKVPSGFVAVVAPELPLMVTDVILVPTSDLKVA
jgi:hypothetical protein